jgi:hypothetical protein
VDVLFLFSQKKNEPKRKVAPGFCCYGPTVVWQRLWLPQHYQCCLGGGYVRSLADSDINLLGSQIRSGGEKEKRGRVVASCGGAFFFLDFWLLFIKKK